MHTVAYRREKMSSHTGRVVLLLILVSCNVLVFQIQDFFRLYQGPLLSTMSEEFSSNPSDGQTFRQQPLGKAVALPSIRGHESEGVNHGSYGGKGDKPHLGGFASNDIDMMGVSPAAWKLMVEQHGIKSLLDVGCGRGISTSWFHMHGVDAQCVEGSHDAVEQSVLPPSLITEHDFSRG